jgi:translocation and assembly module TamA
VRVSEVSVSVHGSGKEKESLTLLVSAFPLRKGDILVHAKYEEAKGLLKARAQELGYLDADFSVHRILVSKKDKSASIELAFETGPQYLFGETRFEGAPEYPERFLRRHITYRRGDVFSHSKLGETQLNMLNSERFNEVLITPDKDKSEELHVPIVIRLKPALPKAFKAGIGYGTDTGIRISAKYQDLNIFRKSHKFQSEVNLSEQLQGIAAGYEIPGTKDINSITAFLFNLKHEDANTYENRLISLEGNRTKSFKKGRLGTGYVRIQVEESTVALEKSKFFLIMPGARFSQQKYDNLVRPTKGFRYAIELRGTTKYFGSDMNLLQALAQGNILFRLPWRLSLSTRVQTALSLQDESIRELPASLRFFAGGDRSVRGYSYQSLGPKDSSGNVIGGKNLLVGSLEIERPVSKDWGVALFYDAGNSFNSLSDIDLFHGAGLGIRYYSPVGTLKLDIARQIGVDNPKFRIHFTVGIQL